MVESSRKPRQPSFASQMIGLGGQHPDPKAIKARLQERDARQAADDRTDVQRFLGDPPRSRSALVCGENKALES
jgi:hypothetical protein